MVFSADIIRSKLQRPLLDESNILRQRLIDHLNQFTQRSATLVTAPAGYGKTTVVNSWLETIDNPIAWVSLDSDDNDLRQCLSYALSAIQSCLREDHVDVFNDIYNMVKAVTLPPLAKLTATLINVFHLMDRPVILVLDDFHHIKEKSILDIFSRILRHPLPNLHLVLICRRDPALPISRLRAKNLLTELRSSELRFTREEIILFVNKEFECEVDPAIADILTIKTEGWVTSLRLACISMRHRGGLLDPKLLEPHLEANYVMRYLFSEVLSQQTPAVTDILLKLSILKRFCGPLCKAVCLLNSNELSARERDGWEHLTTIRNQNLFLIPLDHEHKWFRFHHLFANFLLNQLEKKYSTDSIGALHRMAGAWFVENNLVEEALHHAFYGDDVDGVHQLVVQHGHDLINAQDWPGLKRWLDMLPRKHVEQNIDLLMYEAWYNHVHTSGHDLKSMNMYLEKVHLLFKSYSPDDPIHNSESKGSFDTLRSFRACLHGDAETALKYAHSACEKVPMHRHRLRVFSTIFRTAAYQIAGDSETGLARYRDEINEHITLMGDYEAIYLVNLCHIFWISADLTSMRQTALRSLDVVRARQLHEATAASLYFAGIASYHQNNLQDAEEKLTLLVEDFYYINLTRTTHASIALSLVYIARGDFRRVSDLCHKAMTRVVKDNNHAAIYLLQAFEAEVALIEGRLEEAADWAAEQDRFQPFLLPFLFYSPKITLIKILLSQNTTAGWAQGVDLLDRFDDYLLSVNNQRFRIDTLVLKAIVHMARGNVNDAGKALNEALTIAEKGKFLRLFTNTTSQLVDMLKQLLIQNESKKSYVAHLLAVLAKDEVNKKQYRSDSNPTYHSPQPRPLTNRELDVLHMLTDRLQNKEIASTLNISTETVKSHLKTMFKKLEVSNRQDAVYKAAALGIISRK